MTQAPEILKEIESLATSKNPIAVLFSIAKIRETVLELGDSLINSIELSYYDNTAKRFSEITDRYREAGFYKVTYAYYLDSGKFEEQKAYLDRYFEESYYRDPDLFFFVLDKHPLFHTAFECVKAFAADSETGKKYLALETAEEKAKFLSQAAKLDEREREMVGMPVVHEFLSRFADFEFSKHPEFSSHNERTGRSGRIVTRDVFFASLRSDAHGEVGGYREYWSKSFVHTPFVRRELVNLLSNEDILDCFSYLRSKFLKAPKYNLALTKSNEYRVLIDRARSVSKSDVATKLSYVTEVDQAMGENPIYRERFLNVLRKGIVYDNSIDLVDVLFGISFFGREAFYEIKRRTAATTGSEKAATDFPHLETVKALAILLDSSFLMRLIRPFLIERLSAMFNKKADPYYFVKFLLTIHSARNYKEYKIMSRFFVALEAHAKTGWYGLILRTLQFGWLYGALIALFFLAPLGTFISVFGIATVRLGRRFMEKRFPEMALNSNFQFTGFLTVFAIVSASFGLTFARADNVAIVYSNFHTAINAVSMVASESTTLIVENAMTKVNVLEGGEGESDTEKKSPLSEIDYVNGKEYRDIK
ncbi:MAG: hypothetical protein QG650_314 [Patescibacteria group bacterium]|nr:hypothetical protein [Patescibacteria group bacterium]